MLADTATTRRWRIVAGALQKQLLHQSRAWLGVPMISKGQVIGALRLDHAQPGFFTEQHANLVFTLASQASVAVSNARLYSQKPSCDLPAVNAFNGDPVLPGRIRTSAEWYGVRGGEHSHG